MDKLQALKVQKQQVRKKILQLQGQKVTQNNLTQQTINALYQKKSMLQHQRAQQQKHRQMQQQYNARKAQLQRQKQLQRIRNQKRMIQLQVGMKRIVLTGVQQKVKGINSDQLLTRAMLNAEELGNLKGEELSQKSRPEVRREFEKYLQKEEVRKQKPKYDLYELNEKRHSLFERREEMLMREVLLKEMVEGLGNEEHESMLEGVDVMRCSRQELERLLEQMGIDIQDYKHPLDSKGIVENYPKIEEGIKANLQLKRRQVQNQELMKQKTQQQIRSLRQWVTYYPNQPSISLIRQLLNDILTQIISQYQKRHFPLSTQQKQQKLSQLYQNYNQTLQQNQSYQLSQHIVQSLENHIRKEILLQTAKQIHQLHTFVHDTTEMSFDWLFTKKDYLEYQRTQQQRLKSISLSFKDESQNLAYGKALKQPGNENNGKTKNPEGNVFETEKSTSELVNDIKLLTTEEIFFQQVLIQVKREIVEAVEDGDFKVHWEGGLFVVGAKGVRQVNEEKDVARDVVGFEGEIRNVKNVKKLNNLWIIQASDAVHIYSNWNTQTLPLAIGQRINSPCGLISAIQVYPSFSLLGSLCTILITFQKGQILKYNFNRNRLTSQQRNTTHYTSFPPAIKTGDQPAFPLNNRNVIQYTSEPPKENESIHEFREFFDHHMIEVMFVGFYKENLFVTVDKGMNCAVWMYDQRRGVKVYEPYYTFRVKSDYKTFKESQNPRFNDLYPSSSIPQSPEEMYKKWMQNQAYLKLQIYNNPKKLSAYFKPPKWQNDKSQQPVWKMTYDQKSRRVIKIFQTYYNLADGKSQCKQIKLWKQYLVLLVERQHVMRHDLKTVKIFTFSLQDKKLRTVAIEFDTFQEQKLLSFDILQHKMDSSQFPLIITVSSGKILIFSMLSGQLLKDISQEQTCVKIRNYNFASVTKGFGDGFYGVTRGSIVEFVIRNKNNKQKRDQFNRMVEITRKKYNNLV